jgi:chromate transporter
MIFLELFLGFLKVGCFSFGGAYAAIPLIRDVVLSYGWLTEEQLTYMIAIAESTPGPIMINLATYVGSSQGGVFGSALATLAVVLPSFLIIILVTSILKSCLSNPGVQAVLRGMKPCVVGIVLATGVTMTVHHIFPADGRAVVDIHAVVISLLLFAATVLHKKIRKKKLSPISLIVLSAFLGILIY